ncbi:MAG: M1 family aminopeptidase [Bacteroidota bacterium]
MKYFFLTLAFFLATACIQAQEVLINGSDMCHIAEKEEYAFANRQSFPKSPFTNYNLNYYQIKLSINPDTLYISGSVTSYFKIIEANTTQIGFDLTNDLTVDSVTSANHQLSFVHTSDKKIMITLSAMHQIGETDSLCIHYHGVPLSGQANGTFHKSFHGDSIPIICSLSEPYGSSDWFPCKDDLNDKIDSLDMWVTTPPQYHAAGNGLLVDSVLSPSFAIWHWKHRYPIATYLIAVSVTNYAQFSQYVYAGNDSIEILNYVYPEKLQEIEDELWYTPSIMWVFNNTYCLYPFSKEKYGHAQASIGGGMEHQTMTFLGYFNYGIIAHEMAHQWFGDYITCGSWHDIWLNESFATYSVGLMLEWQPDNFKGWRKEALDNILSLPDGSVYVYDTTLSARIFDYRLSYQKGAMVIYMLRTMVGDSVFYAGLHQYLFDSTLKYGFAYTSDFKNHIAQSSGINLDNFFNQWIYGEGYPDFTIDATQYNDKRLELRIRQHPSHPSVSFFKLNIPIKLKGVNCEMKVQLSPDSLSQVFYFQPECWLDSIIFDPDFQIIARADTIRLRVERDYSNEPLTIFPNPAENLITINRAIGDISHIEIYDVGGHKVFSEAIQYPSSENINIDISRFAKGIYMMKLKIRNVFYYYKIAKT